MMVTEPTFKPAKVEIYDRPTYRTHRAQHKNESSTLSNAAHQKVAEVWDNTPSIARIVRERREELSMPQQSLADALGIRSGEFISMVEAGKRKLDLDKIPRLASTLNLD